MSRYLAGIDAGTDRRGHTEMTTQAAQASGAPEVAP
jgi:hypothetical protein